MDEPYICTICMCAIEEHNNGSGHALECNHSFHVGCILQWYRSGHDTCPNCRSDDYIPIDFTTAERRATVLQKYAKHPDAPARLKKMVKKLKRCRERKRKQWAAMRNFKRDHKDIFTTIRKLNRNYWRSRDVEDETILTLGCMDVKNVVVPRMERQRFHRSRHTRRLFYDSE